MDSKSTKTPLKLFGCDGRCGQYGGCKGIVRRVKVRSGNGLRSWGQYNYCETAIETDIKTGYIVEPVLTLSQEINAVAKDVSKRLDSSSLFEPISEPAMVEICADCKTELKPNRNFKWLRGSDQAPLCDDCSASYDLL